MPNPFNKYSRSILLITITVSAKRYRCIVYISVGNVYNQSIIKSCCFLQHIFKHYDDPLSHRLILNNRFFGCNNFNILNFVLFFFINQQNVSKMYLQYQKRPGDGSLKKRKPLKIFENMKNS